MSETPTSRHVVVVGGTGLVGGHLVDALASDPGVASISAPGRRPTERWAKLAGVEAPVVDFTDPEAKPEAFRGSQLFVCLGTTIRKAGSRVAFRAVDHAAVLATARIALAEGVEDCLVVSSVGANAGARSFYLRVKGEMEEDLAALSFRSLHVFRPSVLTGNRGESRPGERFAIAVGSLVAPLMVGPARRYRPIAAAAVARAMARVARDPGRGRRVWESEEIAELGR